MAGMVESVQLSVRISRNCVLSSVHRIFVHITSGGIVICDTLCTSGFMDDSDIIYAVTFTISL